LIQADDRKNVAKLWELAALGADGEKGFSMMTSAMKSRKRNGEEGEEVCEFEAFGSAVKSKKRGKRITAIG